MTAEPHRIANRNAALRWGSLIIGLLSLQVIIGIICVILATSDPSVAVVPDYYQKSLDWDDSRKVEAVSDELGWSLVLVPLPGQNGASLQGVLRSKEDEPVVIKSGSVSLFHHTRAGDVRMIAIAPNDHGVIAIDECFVVDGLWQVTIDVKNDADERFVSTNDVLVTQANRRFSQEH